MLTYSATYPYTTYADFLRAGLDATPTERYQAYATVPRRVLRAWMTPRGLPGSYHEATRALTAPLWDNGTGEG